MSILQRRKLRLREVETSSKVSLFPLRIPFILLRCCPGQCGGVGTCTCVHYRKKESPKQLLPWPPAGSWLPSLTPPSTASAVFADAIGLKPDARGVVTSLGLNERLFVVNPQEVHELVGRRQSARA
jgi:hypothetical protein